MQSFLSVRGFRGQRIHRLLDVMRGTLKRLNALLEAAQYDVVFVHREALPFPTPVLERALRRRAGRMVFDFDDAIYLSPPCDPLYLDQSHTISWGARLLRHRSLRWLRSSVKFGAIVGASDLIMAGNEHLAARAREYNHMVSVVPTAVDTGRIRPPEARAAAQRVRIGWMGSRSTAPYLEEIGPALGKVLAAYPQAEFRMVGAEWPPLASFPRTSSREWAFEREGADLASFDIGLMPLPDNEWTRGKCGYKALQYMSAGSAVVSSPVGVATEIVRHGENGFLANSTDEWAEYLSRLVADAGLRRRMGAEGREIVERCYSARLWGPRLAEALIGVAAA